MMYQGFAAVYDMFMYNIPYDKWARYISKLLKEEGISDGNVVELGCGTGNITRELAKRGYTMTGIDISTEMLSIAAGKPDIGNITYVNMDMSELELPFTANAVISVCDSINYLTDYEDLKATFAAVKEYLDDDGVFIFDLKSEYFFRSMLGDRTFADNREEASYIWVNTYYEEDKINEYDMTIFVKTKRENVYEKYEEIHYQRAYSLNEITDLLKMMDFSDVKVYNAFTKKPPTKRSGRIYFVCRK